MPVVTVAPIEAVIATAKVEAVRALRITLAGRRTPIVAIVAGDARKRPVAITGSGKEDAVTGLFTCYFIAILAALCSPLPRTVVF